MEDVSQPVSGSEDRKVRRALFPVLDRGFQIKVTLFFLLLILLSHLLLLGLHYRNLNHANQESLGKSGQALQEYLDAEHRTWTRDLVVGVGAITIMVGLVVFFLTQRVSGPLYAMSRVLEAAGKGDLTQRVHLRKGDELTWFATLLNETLDKLEKRGRS